MDFELTEEQVKIQEWARQFAREKIAPRVAEYDQQEAFPSEIVKEMAVAGFLGGVIPKEYGGAGLDYISYALVLEEVGYVCPVMAFIVSLASGMAGTGILRFGTEEQKQKYLVPLAQGRCLAAVGVTEPHSGSDVASLRTTAARKDGGYVLNGVKAWISNLEVADWYTVFATVDQTKRHKGITAFILDKGTPGISLKPEKNKLGFRSISAGDLILEDCYVPSTQVLGNEGEGFKIAMSAVEEGRLTVSARSVGAMQACLDEVTAFARERIAFGSPIGKFQLVQSKITDMVVALETARYLVYRLAWLKQKGGQRLAQISSIAKMYATDMLLRTATEAVQILGAYGCSNESISARVYRNAKVEQIIEGTNEVHCFLIAEQQLGFRKDR